MIHVGAADAPVTLAEIREAVDECRKIKQEKLDILGWEWEMGLHDVIEAESKRSGISLRLVQIPREAMDRRAVDAGDIHFYELAYLEVETEIKGKQARLKLKNFVIPSSELIPDEVRQKIRKWSDFIDYWAVDYEFNDDTFHNQWQDYRTRAKRDLGLTSDWHDYKKAGRYKLLVKVFDIFGNDTTHLLEARV
jgi:adenine-specific DNA-methyltransferase